MANLAAYLQCNRKITPLQLKVKIYGEIFLWPRTTFSAIMTRAM